MTKTKDQPTPAPFTLPTDQDVSELYGVCGYCGTTPAIPNSRRGEYLCAACTKTVLLADACFDHLGELASPSIAAWAHHWAAMGMTREELSSVLGDFMQDHQQNGKAQILTAILDAHPVEAYVASTPDRVLLDATTLPTLDTALVTPTTLPRTGALRMLHQFTAYNADGTVTCPSPGSLSPGLNAVLILNAVDGDALLYHPGYDKETYRVPTNLIHEVQAALGYWKAEDTQS